MPAKRSSTKKGVKKNTKKARVPKTLPDGSVTISMPTHHIARVGPPSLSPPPVLAPGAATLTSLSDDPVDNGVTLASAMANSGSLPAGSDTGEFPAATSVEVSSGITSVNAQALSRAASGQLSVDEYLGKRS